MSSDPCIHCQGVFPTSEHDCGVKYVGTFAQWDAQLDSLGRSLEEATKEVARLNEELMKRDTAPDYERGEMDGQDAMMRHLVKMDENNSAMATAVKKSPYVQGLLRLLAQHGDSLECASYAFGQEFDPEAAKAFHSEFCIVQNRCELFSKDLVQDDG